MKKYSEVKNKIPFDWHKFLKNVKKRKTPLSFKEKDEVEKLSMGWTTCACGNQCSILERDRNGEPKDSRLADLGCAFYANIVDCNWSKAQDTLRNIELRSATLIRDKAVAAQKKINKAMITIDNAQRKIAKAQEVIDIANGFKYH